MRGRRKAEPGIGDILQAQQVARSRRMLVTRQKEALHAGLGPAMAIHAALRSVRRTALRDVAAAIADGVAVIIAVGAKGEAERGATS